MSKETREHLSALVDGEISRDTSRFLVRRLGTDDELRSTWTRYHLVRDCLRHQDGAIAGDDLCDRISQALENEAPGKRSRSLPTGWLKPVTGLAIAASVALMAVVAVGPGVTVSQQGASDVAGIGQVEQFTSPQGQFSPAPYSSQASLGSGTSSKLNSYLVRHYQASGSTGGRGFVTYVPIVITGSKAAVDVESTGDASNQVAEKETESRPR